MVTCIIVEDDENIIAVFSELLESAGIDVLGIGKNGKDGFELYEKFKPNITFIDVLMPEYDGVYGITEIKKKYPDAKIVVVTGDVSNETYEMIKGKVDEIIFKPFEISKILDTIKRLTA